MAVDVHEEAHLWPLASVPGFHALTKTQLVALGGPGAAVLALWCACEPETAIAKVTIALSPTAKSGVLKFVERGRGTIEVLDGIDLQTGAGHFRIDGSWLTEPEGWNAIGPVQKTKTAARKGVQQIAATEAADRTAVRTQAPCACGHGMDFHDPCSKCVCPGYHTSKKTKRFTRRR